MKRAPGSTMRTMTAGPRLRCFWEGGLLVIAFAMGIRPTIAQIVVTKPVHVRHVEGLVCNKSGKPVAKAEITLVRQESIAFKTLTNESGRFAIGRITGRYLLRVTSTGYSPAAQEVIVGSDLRTASRGNTLYVILGPAACMDACSTVYTSKKKFDQDVRMYSANYH